MKKNKKSNKPETEAQKVNLIAAGMVYKNINGDFISFESVGHIVSDLIKITANARHVIQEPCSADDPSRMYDFFIGLMQTITNELNLMAPDYLPGELKSEKDVDNSLLIYRD